MSQARGAGSAQEKHTVYVRWGSRSGQRETLDGPRDACRYDFDTERELAAFLLAINEHDGWLECDTLTPEELEQEPETWEECCGD